MSPYTLCIHLAIFASITHANPTLTNHVRKKIDFNHQAVPWPLFDPQDHQESLRIKRGNSADRKRFLEPPDIPTYIEECVQVIANPGTYVVRPGIGTNRACGVYIAGLHDETITIDVSHVDVSCESGGQIAFFDGWEMNGQIFPGDTDHEHRLNERIAQLCQETFPRGQKLR